MAGGRNANRNPMLYVIHPVCVCLAFDERRGECMTTGVYLVVANHRRVFVSGLQPITAASRTLK